MRRGQYTLITFVIATFILLSLSGIVSNLLTDKIDQIEKAKVLTDLSDRIVMMKSIMNQERQVGIDFTGIHLGLLGGKQRGVSDCGSILSDSPSWLMKSTPYWYSNSSTAEFYTYPGILYSNSSVFKTFKFDDIRQGLYILPVDLPFILDGEVVSNVSPYNGSPYLVRPDNVTPYLALQSGSHYVVLTTSGEDLCDYSLCTDPIYSEFDLLPNSVELNRFIPETTETVTGYERCIPEQSFLEAIHELFLNKYFRIMSKLAYDQIRDITSVGGFNLRNFVLLEYEAKVGRLGDNSIFITFFPLNLPLFKLVNEDESTAIYQGSPIVYDAFQSDLASFQRIGRELIDERVINELVNAIIDKHSAFDFFATVKLRGSSHSRYEEVINEKLGGAPTDENWRITAFEGTELDLEGFFEGAVTKPYCLYYLKEACQFLSDEVSTGIRDTPYVAGLYAVYEEFTKDYIIDNPVYVEWTDESTLASCQACHDVGEFNNPCLNFTDTSCSDCFEALMGVDYGAIPFVDDDLDGKHDDGPDICFDAVQEEIVPLLQDYLVYRFKDLQDGLNQRYGFGWMLDAERINVTSIEFKEIVSSGQYFNSSCFDCDSVALIGESECNFLKSDLKIESASVKVFSELTGEYVYNRSDGFLDSDNSEKPIGLELTVKNNGNTDETVYLTVLVDAYNNLNRFGSDYNYYVLSTAPTLIGSLPDELFVTGYNPDEPFEMLPFDDDDLFDVMSFSEVIGSISKGTEEIFNYVDIFTPASYELNLKSHLVRVCVHTKYNDEWDWSDNCVDFDVGVCTNGDSSETCCTFPDVGGTWFESNSFEFPPIPYDFVTTQGSVTNKDYSLFPDDLFATIPGDGKLSISTSRFNINTITSLSVKGRAEDGSDPTIIVEVKAGSVGTSVFMSFGLQNGWKSQNYPSTPISTLILKAKNANTMVHIDGIRINGVYLRDELTKGICCGDDKPASDDDVTFCNQPCDVVVGNSVPDCYANDLTATCDDGPDNGTPYCGFCDDDDFLINSNTFCYQGDVKSCEPPLGSYVAGRVRGAIDAKNYNAPKYDYYCTGI